MLELKLLAHLPKPLLPFAFVRQWICVRAPELFHHLALRDEGALGFWILVRVVQCSQGELRAGHQRGFVGAAKLFVQVMHCGIERAPALGMRLAPERGLGVERREIPEGDANLPHRLEGAADHVAENFFEGGVDD